MARPDILWIVTTQWRGGALGAAGDANAHTPCLDSLAARGVSFPHAVTPHPFGPFARAAMLTGVTCPENGVRDYYDPLPAGTRTIAHAMQDRGYATGWFGKWHLARRDPVAPLVGDAHARMIVPPESRGGFGFWEGFESGFLLNDPWLHGSRLPEPKLFHGYQSDVLCERAADWLAGASTAPLPWFCVVSLEPPHPPYDAPAPVSRVDAAAIAPAPNVPEAGEIRSRARRELAGYYAHIRATDRAIGRLVESVTARERPNRPAPIVVVTSVHGDMHGAHGLFRKGWPYEESVRVPFIVCAPGLDSSVAGCPVSLLDLPGITTAWADGRIWRPHAVAAGISMPSVVALEHQADRKWHGLRAAEWKVVFEESGSPWLAFDLSRDPWELENLIGKPRGDALIARARALLEGR